MSIEKPSDDKATQPVKGADYPNLASGPVLKEGVDAKQLIHGFLQRTLLAFPVCSEDGEAGVRASALIKALVPVYFQSIGYEALPEQLEQIREFHPVEDLLRHLKNCVDNGVETYLWNDALVYVSGLPDMPEREKLETLLVRDDFVVPEAAQDYHRETYGLLDEAPDSQPTVNLDQISDEIVASGFEQPLTDDHDGHASTTDTFDTEIDEIDDQQGNTAPIGEDLFAGHTQNVREPVEGVSKHKLKVHRGLAIGLGLVAAVGASYFAYTEFVSAASTSPVLSEEAKQLALIDEKLRSHKNIQPTQTLDRASKPQSKTNEVREVTPYQEPLENSVVLQSVLSRHIDGVPNSSDIPAPISTQGKIRVLDQNPVAGTITASSADQSPLTATSSSKEVMVLSQAVASLTTEMGDLKSLLQADKRPQIVIDEDLKAVENLLKLNSQRLVAMQDKVALIEGRLEGPKRSDNSVRSSAAVAKPTSQLEPITNYHLSAVSGKTAYIGHTLEKKEQDLFTLTEGDNGTLFGDVIEVGQDVNGRFFVRTTAGTIKEG